MCASPSISTSRNAAGSLPILQLSDRIQSKPGPACRCKQEPPEPAPFGQCVGVPDVARPPVDIRPLEVGVGDGGGKGLDGTTVSTPTRRWIGATMCGDCSPVCRPGRNANPIQRNRWSNALRKRFPRSSRRTARRSKSSSRCSIIPVTVIPRCLCGPILRSGGAAKSSAGSLRPSKRRRVRKFPAHRACVGAHSL